MFTGFKIHPLVQDKKILDLKLKDELELKIKNEITENLDPLWENYQKDRLHLDQHLSFDLIKEEATGEIVGFSGLFNGGRYPEGVFRGLNRSYTFKKYRTQNMKLKGWHLDWVLPLQIQKNIQKIQVVFFSREGLHSQKLVERLCKRLTLSTKLSWNRFADMVQVAPGMSPTSFQWIGTAQVAENNLEQVLAPLNKITASEYVKIFNSTQ